MATGEKARQAVPLEAGMGPENPPCPACGEPLFGWAMVRPAGLPVRRCERCGLAVKGDPAEAEEATAAASKVAAEGEAPNRASLQAWIGGSGWFALEPDRRFLFTSESLRLLGHPGGRPRPAVAGMWQTLLNAFTFGHDVALGRIGRATATSAPKPWQRRVDLAISLLATPLALPVALVAELLAAAAGRGGRLRIA